MTRRTLTAVLLAAVASVAFASPALAAPGDLPRLTGVPPAGSASDWFDDHSVSGDRHLSWSPAAGAIYTNDSGQPSQREPHDLEFQPSITVGGPGGLEVCGYPSGTVGWMRAYQVAPGAMSGPSCPAAEPVGGQFGWFRYVYGRHPEALNRWHLMDVERSALVPLTGGIPTVWDNHWGTCLNLLSAALNCEANRDVAGLDAGVASGATKVTGLGYVDAQTIPITVPTGEILPDGQYQIVTLTNPYGLIKENGGAIGSVNCVTVDLTIPDTGDHFGEPTITVADPSPAECRLPTALDPALTGPSGFDPMAGAEAVPGCVFTGSHCWPNPTMAPHEGDYINAHSLATGNPSIIASTPVAQGSAIPEAISATGRRLPPGGAVAAPTPSPTATPMPAPSAASTQPSTATRSAMTTAKSHTRSALRTVFGTGLSRLQVACRLRPASAATCTVSWRKSGARYSGRLYLRNTRIRGRIRWQYRVDVTKRKNGRTTHVRRDYRTGGTVADEHA
jgi:hypothetical protein